MNPRNYPTHRGGVDLDEIDQTWIENCESVKKLHAAVKLLKDDGYYTDMIKLAEDKLCQLDPEYKRRKELPRATAEDKEKAAKGLEDFLNEINEPKEKTSEQLKLEKAKEERLKGNECMVGQDYKEAIQYYEKSLKLNPKEASTYCNRALAYIKRKDYKNGLADANATIGLELDYVKAYYRRAEAWLGLRDYDKAYTDIQVVLGLEPNSTDAQYIIDKIEKKAKSDKVDVNEYKVNKAAAFILKKIEEYRSLKKEVENNPEEFMKVRTNEEEYVSSESEHEPDSETLQPYPESQYNSSQPKEVKKESGKAPKKFIWSEDELVSMEPSQLLALEANTNTTESNPKPIYSVDPKTMLSIYNQYKEEGKKLQDSGQYEDAIQLYQQGIKHLDTLKGLKKETKSECKVIAYNNIAMCYKQLQDSENVIFYLTKVIELSEQRNILEASRIRAYAYESLDKLAEAKSDWKQILDIQRDNKEARTGLVRIKEAIKRDRSQKVGEILRSINTQLEEYKNTGSKEFQKGSYKEAADWFSIGIKLFTNKCDIDNLQYIPKELLVIICQLYINRAVCYYTMERYNKVIEDTGFVIDKIDGKNAKAYYRRGLTYSKLNDNKKALEDFNIALSIEPNNKLFKNAKDELYSTTKEVFKEVEKPKTAYAFESIWRSYENDYDELAKFLEKSMDPEYFRSLFKESEIPSELYLSIIKALNHSFNEHTSDTIQKPFKYLEVMIETKNAHINALMYKKDELKDLDELLKKLESKGIEVKELRSNYNLQ